jgi:hypothetical protein
VPAVTAEGLLAELATITGLSAAEIHDFIMCTPTQQRIIAQTYRGAAWVESPDTFGEFVRILGLIGQIAGVVSGVSGAIAAVSALRTVL